MTREGHSYLNNILANLHEPIIKWDGSWTVVSFSIPEKNRDKRDKFRRFIGSIGMKNLFSSIWISPLDVTSGILEYSKKNNLNNEIISIRTNHITGLSNDTLRSLWSFDSYRSSLEDFITESNNFHKDHPDQQYEVKKRIFEYALLLEGLPKVPIDFMPKDWPYLRAKMTYKKLKARLN